jgi:hypothetical protein
MIWISSPAYAYLYCSLLCTTGSLCTVPYLVSTFVTPIFGAEGQTRKTENRIAQWLFVASLA